jgi:NADPH:quinone reductase-like Zn-dependent oxidoreductase
MKTLVVWLPPGLDAEQCAVSPYGLLTAERCLTAEVGTRP